MAFSSATDADNLNTEVARLEADGWTTLLFSASTSSRAGIDADSCAALTDQVGVRASGAIQFLPAQVVTQFGGAPVPLVLIDARLAGSSETATAMLSEPSASAAGHPNYVEVEWPGLKVVYPARPAAAVLTPLGLDSSVAITVRFAGTLVPACIARVEPWAADVVRAQLSAALHVSDADVTVSSYHPIDIHPYDRFTKRPSRWFPFEAGCFLGLVYFLLSRTRGNEIATYRLAATTRHDMFTLCQLELLITSGFYVASGVATLVALEALRQVSYVRAWPMFALGAMAQYVVSSLGAWVVTRRSVAEMAKDR